MPTKKKTENSAVKGNSPVSTKFEFPAPDAREVCLGGSFNNWNATANPMKKDKKGIWKVTLKLAPGRYEYRYFVDGKWENDSSCSGCVPNDFGSMNCVRVV